MHTNLNCKRWYIRATVARAPYTKVLTILNGTEQNMTVHNFKKIGGRLDGHYF